MPCSTRSARKAGGWLARRRITARCFSSRSKSAGPQFFPTAANSHCRLLAGFWRMNLLLEAANAQLEMVRAQKNQFKKGRNVPFTLVGEPCLIQTVEEAGLGTPHPIAIFLFHCSPSLLC